MPAVLAEIAESGWRRAAYGTDRVGKSSTLAAIIDRITRQRPITNLRSRTRSNSCIITKNRPSTTRAGPTRKILHLLAGSLRQSTKVILVGRCVISKRRDRTGSCETGHLVLSTLHTIDASKTIDRIIGLYPKNENASFEASRETFGLSFAKADTHHRRKGPHRRS